ncbi:MAG TPA: PQQ-binding-like beta-propeller repeat protein [Tepidisphaeraceae bacterium]
MGFVLTFATLSRGATTRPAADTWPQFRGPTGQGISEATNVPVEWNARKNVAWSAPIPGRGWSSPVVAGGKVYLTTSIARPRGPVSLFAVCIDARTGKPVWDTEVFEPGTSLASQMHGKNTLASPTPIVTEDRLYVHFGHMGTAALDLSGKIVWAQTGLKYEPVHGAGGSPALVGDLLVVDCDGASDPFIAALDTKTGQIKWKTPRNSDARKTFSFSTPLPIKVDGQTQIISPASGFVGSYDPADGHELWRVRYGDGYSVVPRPVFAYDLLFISSGFDTPTILAIRAGGASGDATRSHVAWARPKGGPNTPSMLAAGDELYVVSDAGIATCLDARTGKVYWTHRLDGTFSASPVLAEGRVYFQTEGGAAIVIKAAKTFQPLAENELGERSLASPAIVDGAIFIRTEHRLWKIATVAR